MKKNSKRCIEDRKLERTRIYFTQYDINGKRFLDRTDIGHGGETRAGQLRMLLSEAPTGDT